MMLVTKRKCFVDVFKITDGNVFQKIDELDNFDIFFCIIFWGLRNENYQMGVLSEIPVCYITEHVTNKGWFAHLSFFKDNIAPR